MYLPMPRNKKLSLTFFGIIETKIKEYEGGKTMEVYINNNKVVDRSEVCFYISWILFSIVTLNLICHYLEVNNIHRTLNIYKALY